MKKQNLSSFQEFALGKKKKASVSRKRAVIYTRVSSKEQENNTSLETQLLACREYALSHGYEVVKEFGGTYESAKSDEERSEFKSMLAYLRQGRNRADCIIVYSLDRFSRTGGSAISIKESLRKRGIDVQAVTQPADVNSPTGALMQNVNLIFSRFDNDLRRQKCVTGMKARLYKGYTCGNAPIGYDNAKVDGEKVIVPGELAPLIAQAFKWKAKEGITNEEIRTRLRARGWPVPRQTLSRVLRNPVYCGMVRHKLLEGEVIEGKHKAIISKKLFLKANEANAHIPKGYQVKDENEFVPLKRFIRCEGCGEKLRGYQVKSKGLWYYKCNSKGCKCNRNADVVHDLFRSELRKVHLPQMLKAPIQHHLEFLTANIEETQASEVALLKRQKTEQEKRLEKLEEKFIFDDISPELYHKHKEKIAGNLAQTEKEIEHTLMKKSNIDFFLTECLDFASNLAPMWEKGGYHQKQKLQNIVFPEGIYYDRQSDKCRTGRLNEVFRLTSSLSTILMDKNDKSSVKNEALSLLVEVDSGLSNPFVEDLRQFG